MKTFILPVDFSPVSLNAAYYGLELARLTGGSLTLLHVCQIPQSVNEVPVPDDVIESLFEEAEKRITDLKSTLAEKGENAVRIYSEVKSGNVFVETEKLCQALKPFAVIMGTHGAGAVHRLLIGSNTIYAARHLKWPLIIVPQGSRFQGIRNIGLACDFREMIKTLPDNEIRNLVHITGATLHILHVNPPQEKELNPEEIEESGWVREMLFDVHPVFDFITGDDTDKSIMEYALKNNLDLLIAIPKKHNFLHALTHKSHISDLVLHSQVPVMAMQV